MTQHDIKGLALVLAIQAEIEGMKAYNTQREIEGNSIGYSENEFNNMAEQLRNLAYKHDEQS